MNFREDLETIARRAFLTITRGVVKKTDDAKKMQELTVDSLHAEGRTGVEHWQPYGFCAYPLTPAGDGTGAEVLLAHVGGSRSHMVALAVADRRHRPREAQAGEVILYDNQGQQVALRSGGVRVKAASGKTVEVEAGTVTLTVKTGRVEVKIGGTVQFIIADPPNDLQGCAAVSTVAGPAEAVFAKPA